MKKIIVLFMLTAIVTLSMSATKPAADTKKYGDFKNLQILPKDISEDSLDMIMDHFKEALGVKCNFCHVNNGPDDWNFASDDKEEKGFARYMMRMTMELNAKYFNFDSSSKPEAITTIKCITCHRGNTRPDGSDEEDEKKE